MSAVETLELLQVQGPHVKCFDPEELTGLSETKGINLFHWRWGSSLCCLCFPAVAQSRRSAPDGLTAAVPQHGAISLLCKVIT